MWYRQTYQNYEQSWQKMHTLIEHKVHTFKVIFWHQKSTESFWIFFFFCKEYLKTLIFKVLSFLKMCSIFVGYCHLFIILVGLTWYSEKMPISNRCIHHLMPNLIKTSWTISNLPVWLEQSAHSQCLRVLPVPKVIYPK